MVNRRQPTAPATIDATIRSTRHRLLPVFRESPDAIVGVLDVAIYLHENRALAPATRNPVFVPETMAAELLFGSHLAEPRDIAIVLDEHGGFEGIATASDIIEDLIRDAAPPIAGAEEIRHLEDGRLIASGNARLEDLEDELGAGLAVDGIDTIGGLLFIPTRPRHQCPRPTA